MLQAKGIKKPAELEQGGRTCLGEARGRRGEMVVRAALVFAWQLPGPYGYSLGPARRRFNSNVPRFYSAFTIMETASWLARSPTPRMATFREAASTMTLQRMQDDSKPQRSQRKRSGFRSSSSRFPGSRPISPHPRRCRGSTFMAPRAGGLFHLLCTLPIFRRRLTIWPVPLPVCRHLGL